MHCKDLLSSLRLSCKKSPPLEAIAILSCRLNTNPAKRQSSVSIITLILKFIWKDRKTQTSQHHVTEKRLAD